MWTSAKRRTFSTVAKWYRKAADSGDLKSMYQLGTFLISGRGGVKDPVRGYELVLKAAQKNYPEAEMMIGAIYLKPDAYLPFKRDPKKALAFIRLSAEHNYAKAQNILGALYLYGDSNLKINKDYDECLKWYRKAAEQNDPEGLCSLGYLYENGYGVRKNAYEASIWYRKAALLGFDQSEVRLGRLYIEGKGVPKDYVQAYAYLSIAAAANNKNAVDLLNYIEPKMTSSQKEKSMEMARDIFEKLQKL